MDVAMVTVVTASISAIAAALAAAFSFSQVKQTKKLSEEATASAKKLRAFDYSASSSAKFFEAWQDIEIDFGTDGRIRGIAVSADVVRALLLENRDRLDNFNYILNFFGRMATAIDEGVIDEQVARKLSRYKFLAFWRTFETYFVIEFEAKPELAELYADSLRLYETWREN